MTRCWSPTTTVSGRRLPGIKSSGFNIYNKSKETRQTTAKNNQKPVNLYFLKVRNVFTYMVVIDWKFLFRLYIKFQGQDS